VSYTEQRERQRMVKRAEKKVADAEAQIADIEAQIADVEAKIAAGDVEREIFDRHASLGKQLDNAMSLWELAGVELEELKQSLSL
jgi:ATP-binding cassette subfamily F protein 3